MNTDRLRLLVELDRLGTMRAVAEELDSTTSSVSHQLALLGAELGVELVERVGRTVRLTSAGQRAVARSRRILSDTEALQAEAAGTADPVGTVRVAGFATAIRHSFLPAIHGLAAEHPDVRVVIAEHEPSEARALLAADEVDLALVFDYDLAPAPTDPAFDVHPLWTTPWYLGVPTDLVPPGRTSVEVVRHLAQAVWIGDSWNEFDERVLELLASMAGTSLRITHRCDNLALVADLIAEGLGCGILPEGFPVPAGVALVPLRDPGVRMRAFALTRSGRDRWAPLAVVLQQLLRQHGSSGPGAPPEA